MKKETDIRETIPRLQQLVPHMRDQLIGLRNGVTFEKARLRYSTTVDRLAAQGLGRRTVTDFLRILKTRCAARRVFFASTG